MPIHDWSRVDAGVFHDFHQRWIISMCNALNESLLPEDYYALAEQRSGSRVPDVVTLSAPQGRNGTSGDRGPATVTKSRPKTSFVVEAEAETYLRKQSRLAVKHVSDDRIVAIIEILSEGNKASRFAFEDFVEKILDLLRAGVQVLLIDILPRTRRDPKGIHAAIWQRIADEPTVSPKKKPLSLVSYEVGETTRGYFEPVAVGMSLPDMPLFLEYGWHVPVPLEATYQAAYRTVPLRWRRVIDGE